MGSLTQTQRHCGGLRTQTCYANPPQAPCFPRHRIDFSDATALRIAYRTSASSVKHLIPEEFEIEDEPLMGAALLNWGYSPFGSYTESIFTIEIWFQGVLYDYTLELILENEGAIFMGREQPGCPKLFGRVEFDPQKVLTKPGWVAGHIERPIGTHIVHFNWRPEKKIQGKQKLPTAHHHKKLISLRIFPDPDVSQKPTISEFVIIETAWPEAELWKGQGTVTFSPSSSSISSVSHLFPVVRYEGAKLLRNADHYIIGGSKSIPIVGDTVTKVT